MDVRTYDRTDAIAIEALFRSVFSDSEGELEGERIGNLVREMMATTDGQDLYCYLALEGEEILGAIFFSRLSFTSDLNVFILGPVAVRTNWQGQGIGQKLIAHGLQDLKHHHVNFVITYGNPAFYSKVGLHSISARKIRPPFELSRPEGWLGQALADEPFDEMLGDCKCVAALNDPVYW